MVAAWSFRRTVAAHASMCGLTFAACVCGLSHTAAQSSPAARPATSLAPSEPPTTSEAAPSSTPNSPAPSESEPPAATRAEYRAVVERAIAEFDLGHPAEARALFLRANALWPSARTKRTLGMTAFELRMYPRALEELQGALEDPRRPLPPEQRAQVTELIEKTKAFLGRYQLQLAPKDAELLIDGTRQATDKPLVLGVGIHQLVSRTTGYADLYRELVVQGGEDETLELRLIRVRPESPAPASPAPEPQIAETTVPVTPRASDNESSHRPNRIPAIVALSAAGLGVAVGTTSGIIAFTKKHDRDHTAGYRAADISTGSWIVAGAAGATGLILWLLQDAESEKPHVQPVIGLSSLGVAGTF